MMVRASWSVSDRPAIELVDRALVARRPEKPRSLKSGMFEDEAHELALKGNADEDIVDCDYWEGSLEITLEKEGEVEEDPDYGYKLEQEEKEEDVEDDPHYPQPG